MSDVTLNTASGSITLTPKPIGNSKQKSRIFQLKMETKMTPGYIQKLTEILPTMTFAIT